MSARRERRSTRRYLDISPEPASPRTSTPSRSAGASKLAVLPVVVEEAQGVTSPGKKKHGRKGADIEQAEVLSGKEEEVVEEEEEDEAWNDFAAEYFEVVEQLPLELHRNFALLRELDEQTQRHTADLLELVKRYAGERVEEAKEVREAHERAEVAPATPGDQSEAQTGNPQGPSGAADCATSADAVGHPDPPSAGEAATTPAAVETGVEGLESEADAPGGGTSSIQTPAEDTAASGDMAAAAAIDDDLMAIDSPAAPAPAEAGPSGSPIAPRQTAPEVMSEAAMNAPVAPKRQPWTFLPEIGRVAQEMIRSADEKVSIAVAAYNSVDRHIRAIDAALAASSSSLLGMQPGTSASHHAEAAGALPTQSGGPVNPNAALEDDMTVGLAGTGAGSTSGGRKRDRERARKRELKRRKEAEKNAGAQAAEMAPPAVEPAWEGGLAVNGLKIDPNEPKYCYCNGVSAGVMIACDNEDCPREWFHLECVGMTAEPKGKWWCNDCRPAKKQKK